MGVGMALGAIAGDLGPLLTGAGGTRNVSLLAPLPPASPPAPSSAKSSSVVGGRASPSLAATRGVPATDGVAEAARWEVEPLVFLRLGTNLV